MQTSDFYSARVPITRGTCGHQHMVKAALDNCQAALNNHWAQRRGRKPQAVGGGKKRGMKAGRQRKGRGN